jgi:hypothetical protein
VSDTTTVHSDGSGSRIDELRRRWAAEARAAGRINEARALEVHDDDPAEDVLAKLREEREEPVW